jgi:hypothetical protein
MKSSKYKLFLEEKYGIIKPTTTFNLYNPTHIKIISLYQKAYSENFYFGSTRIELIAYYREKLIHIQKDLYRQTGVLYQVRTEPIKEIFKVFKDDHRKRRMSKMSRRQNNMQK